MKKIVTYILIATLALGLIGCASVDNTQEPDDSPRQNDDAIEQEDKEDIEEKGNDEIETIDDEDKSNEEQEDTEEETSNEEVKAILYFSDENAEYLNGEEREFDELTPEALLNALIDGPQDDANRKTIPDGTKLIDVEIKDNIAYANFSKELKENHWGGSTGEIHTLYSIVNTLALNPDLDIDSVQILIDGIFTESLAGHMDISEPLKPDAELSKLE